MRDVISIPSTGHHSRPVVALPPPSRQNLFFKRTGNPVLLQSLDFKRSDKAEEQSERGLRYEVERHTGRGESTGSLIIFWNLGSLV